MSEALIISTIVLIIIIDLLCFTLFKNYFTYEVEETLLIDEKEKVIKKLDSKRI